MEPTNEEPMPEEVKRKDVKKVKKHRHKWKDDYCDCPFCEGPHQTCECGEMRENPKYK